MPKSATGANERAGGGRVGGFTLIELLVVLVIAAVLGGFVLLRVGDDDPVSRAERHLQQLRARLDLACDRALISGNPRGLRLDREGYSFLRLAQGRWQPAGGDDPAGAGWPEGLELVADVAGHSGVFNRGRAPQVVCTGVEPGTPFRISLGRGAERRELEWPS